jgi:hypothetical protein
LLLLAAAVTATGWATYNDAAGQWVGELHEGIASAMLALVGVHVAAVVASSWLHRENLVGSMLTGRKFAPPGDAIRGRWRSVAAVVLAAVIGFWWWQWQSPGQGLAGAPAHWGTMAHHEDEDD